MQYSYLQNPDIAARASPLVTIRHAVILASALLAGCMVTMSDAEFYAKFSEATETRFYSASDAATATRNGECKVLESGRFYATLIGLTAGKDLDNGAEGVDAIVTRDGGNAYRIDTYSWIPYGSAGRQLEVVFDTLLCTLGNEQNHTIMRG